ncbi:MAG: hypothetical protein CL762_03735 [Chloroflexi bacterium]|nr:hypothetical protein [Chloroflexota bacterium]
MRALIIGSSVVARQIGESLNEKVEKLVFLDSDSYKFHSWDLFKEDNISFQSGDIQKMDTLLDAGLEESDIVVVDAGEDAVSLFVAQKCKINLSTSIFIVLDDMSISDIYQNSGFVILDSHNLSSNKIIKHLEKF